VAPALALLFVMNIFPLMWSFGLSFFDYKANRIKSLSFIGFDNYARVLNDVDVWSRLQTTALVVILTVSCQMVIGFLLALLFEREFPGRRILLMLVADADDAELRRGRRLLPLLLRPDLGLVSQAWKAVTGESLTSSQHPRTGAISSAIVSPILMCALGAVVAGLVSDSPVTAFQAWLTKPKVGRSSSGRRRRPRRSSASSASAPASAGCGAGNSRSNKSASRKPITIWQLTVRMTTSAVVCSRDQTSTSFSTRA